MFSLWFIELYWIPIIVHSSISFVWMKPHYIILSPYHIPIVYHHFLVGGLNPSEKYEFVSWDHDIPNIWKVIIQSCSKPPTSTNQFLCKSSFGYGSKLGTPIIGLLILNLGGSSTMKNGPTLKIWHSPILDWCCEADICGSIGVPRVAELFCHVHFQFVECFSLDFWGRRTCFYNVIV